MYPAVIRMAKIAHKFVCTGHKLVILNYHPGQYYKNHTNVDVNKYPISSSNSDNGPTYTAGVPTQIYFYVPFIYAKIST